MFENLKKSMDKGLDLIYETTDKIEKAAKDFAKENNLTKEEGKKLLDYWVKRSDEAKKKLEKQVAEIQKAALAKMDLVTKADVKKLEDRIKKLESYHKTPVKIKPKTATRKKTAIKPA